MNLVKRVNHVNFVKLENLVNLVPRVNFVKLLSLVKLRNLANLVKRAKLVSHATVKSLVMGLGADEGYARELLSIYKNLQYTKSLRQENRQ